MEECEAAFEDLKSYLTGPLILTRLELEEDLYIYVVVFDHVVSSVLIRQYEGV